MKKIALSLLIIILNLQILADSSLPPKDRKEDIPRIATISIYTNL